MLCPKCGKESTNLRVCAHCQTPYPTDGSAEAASARTTRAVPAARASKASAGPPGDWTSPARRSRLMRWSAIGALAAITLAYYISSRERPIPVGVVLPNLIGGTMSPSEAAVTLDAFNGPGQLDMRNGVLVVRMEAAGFPQRRDGQLALAQQFARADEIVQGKKRAISFLDPGGSEFARADPAKGVTMTR